MQVDGGINGSIHSPMAIKYGKVGLFFLVLSEEKQKLLRKWGTAWLKWPSPSLLLPSPRQRRQRASLFRHAWSPANIPAVLGHLCLRTQHCNTAWPISSGWSALSVKVVVLYHGNRPQAVALKLLLQVVGRGEGRERMRRNWAKAVLDCVFFSKWKYSNKIRN